MTGILKAAWMPLLLVLLATPVQAQSDEVEAARTAAEAWLTLVDDGEYGQSWEEAAAAFRSQVPKQKWEGMVGSVRSKVGASKSRTVKSAKYTKELPNAPPGEYVVIEYDAAFENLPSALEVVTPMKEEDGSWRVSGYFVRPPK